MRVYRGKEVGRIGERRSNRNFKNVIQKFGK